MSGLKLGVKLGNILLNESSDIALMSFILFNRQIEQALSDLNEAIKVAPATLSRDVRKVLLKAIEETENAHRLPETSGGTINLMDTSTDIIQECCSSGVDSSLTSTSERG